MAKPGDYLELLKPRLISLLLFVAVVSMVVAEGYSLSFFKLVAMLILGFMSLGGAAALNNYIDRDVDVIMERTRDRAIPSGRIKPRAALALGLGLVASSIVLSAIFLSLLTAFFMGLGAFAYAWFYTAFLKRRTPMGVVWGGVAGSIPALGGWAAVSNTGWFAPIMIFLIVYLWQPSHFWALSMCVKDDYKNAGIPVLPALKNENQVAKSMLISNIILIPFTYIMYLTGALSPFYIYAITALNIALLAYSVLAYLDHEKRVLWANYRYSLVYMFMILTSMVVARLV
ncbi:MAG: heme o synthase [Thermoprotei archaeon]